MLASAAPFFSSSVGNSFNLSLCYVRMLSDAKIYAIVVLLLFWVEINVSNKYLAHNGCDSTSDGRGAVLGPIGNCFTCSSGGSKYRK